MTHAIRQPRILLALLASVTAICLGLLGPKPAEANWANFCNPVTLAGYGNCTGAPFKMNQIYGWGDQHSVCVALHNSIPETKRCSSGPGAGVYTPLFNVITWYPLIQNNAAGSNTVHGISLGP
jgi:hypothetical protein